MVPSTKGSISSQTITATSKQEVYVAPAYVIRFADMKAFILNLALSTLALAAPVLVHEKRQVTENEFSDGPCRDIILFFVRGTTEFGNMVGGHNSQLVIL
jgi:hypothetical protein